MRGTSFSLDEKVFNVNSSTNVQGVRLYLPYLPSTSSSPDTIIDGI